MGLPETAAKLSAMPEASSDAAACDDLERLREMLFGDELRRQREEIESMKAAHREDLQRLESVMRATIEAAEARWTHRASEHSPGAELAELHQRIENEAHRREEASDDLERRIGAIQEALGQTITGLREAQQGYEEQVRTQLLSQGELLSKSIHKHHDDAMNALAHNAAELRRSKADRDTIAELFLGVAERLTIEP